MTDGDGADGRIVEHVLERMPYNLSIGNNSKISVQLNVALLPPAEQFAKYEKTRPGTAEHIIAAADQQRLHRQKLESDLVAGSERRRDRGQIVGAGLSLVGLFGAIALGLFGDPWVAGLMVIASFGGPLAANRLAALQHADTPTRCDRAPHPIEISEGSSATKDERDP